MRNLFVVVAALITLSACTTLEKPFLYEAKKADRSVTLFGTVHMGVPASDLPDSVFKALENADTAWFEIDLTKQRNSAEPEFFIPEGQPKLDTLLSKEEFDALVMGLPGWKPESVAELRPKWALTFYSLNFAAKISRNEANAFEFRNGLDMALTEKAVALKKPIETLDTEMYGICDEKEDERSIQGIKDAVRGQRGDVLYEKVVELIDTYRSGDEAKLARLGAQDDDACLIRDRNQRWANILSLNVKKDQHPLVVVGALHLVTIGKTPSLLDLLKQQG